MKKVCICLFGISKLGSYDHWDNKHKFSIDYRHSLDNYRKVLINHFIKEGYQIDFFISTYHSNIEKDLMIDFAPKKYAFTMFKPGMSNHTGRNMHFTNVLNLAKTYSIQNKFNYDLVIATRFDMMFKRSLSDSRILYDKFNISFMLEHMNLPAEDLPRIDDNLYIFNGRFLSPLLLALSQFNQNISYHLVYKYITRVINKNDINFMLNGNVFMRDNPIYYLVRNRRETVVNKPVETNVVTSKNLSFTNTVDDRRLRKTQLILVNKKGAKPMVKFSAPLPVKKTWPQLAQHSSKVQLVSKGVRNTKI